MTQEIAPSHAPVAPVESPKPYHHGNLRNAILAAALDALRERAPADLSLRELARAVGVGHSAIYAHFRDRDELLAVIAGDGFRALAVALDAALKADPGNPTSALAAAYVRFARSSPSHYRTMFRPENVEARNLAHVAEVSDCCFQLLVDAVQGLRPLSETEARERSIGIWSMLHGLVMLGENGGPLQQKLPPENEVAFASKMVRMLAESVAGPD